MSGLNVFIPGDSITAFAVNSNFSFLKNKIDESAGEAKAPVGLISIWSGNFSSVPLGWSVCDGSNGTPNLRDRFIIGAGDSYSLNSTGGVNAVALTVENLPSHSHGLGTLNAGSSGAHNHTYRRYSILRDRSSHSSSGVWRRTRGASTSSSGAHSHGSSGSTALTGNGEAHENRPPYYALFFIMATG